MASCAIFFRLAGESFSALALPPLRPPKRPSATAAGFLVRTGAGWPVDKATMRAAIWFLSLGMPELIFLNRLSKRDFQTEPLPKSTTKIASLPICERCLRDVRGGMARLRTQVTANAGAYNIALSITFIIASTGAHGRFSMR
jgi:hypothetical protein